MVVLSVLAAACIGGAAEDEVERQSGAQEIGHLGVYQHDQYGACVPWRTGDYEHNGCSCTWTVDECRNSEGAISYATSSVCGCIN